MIVADQDDIRRADRRLSFLSRQHRLVGAKCLIEFAEIFAPAMRILRADFPLYFRERMQLRRAPSRS